MVKYLREYISYTDNDDMTLATVLAINNCQAGDTLYLGGGELHFYPAHAYERFYYISNNDFSIKKIAFPLIEKTDLTIDGEGARLVFHGKIMPFAIEKCQNIVLKNLSIDYAEPAYFEAKITDSGENFAEMEYDDSVFHCEIVGQQFRFYGKDWENLTEKVLVNEFDPAYKGPMPQTPTYFAFLGQPQEAPPHYASLYRFLKASKPAENKLRFDGKIGFKHTIGKYWLCTYDNREFPGVFACDSKDLQINNVILHHTLSMGIICQLCENIVLEKVLAIPSQGRMLSVNADATHFVNCTGLIHMKDCRFESMMDDVTNVHGIYVPVQRRLDEHRVLLRFGHPQQRGINIFKTCDKVRLVDNQTLQPYAEFEVRDSRLISKEYLLLETKEGLPQMIPKGNVFENHSRMPEVHIEGCRSGYNRPRGFLLSTCKRVVVENCAFYNLHHAIAIMGDANSWYESGPCGEVILRNNHFEHAAYSGTSIIEGGPAIPLQTDKSYHGSLVVEHNYFNRDEARNINVFSFEQVISQNNLYVTEK